MNQVPMIKIVNGEKYYLKLTVGQRWQHFVLMTTFIVCVITGMPQKYYYYNWARELADIFGGYMMMRTIHRTSGVIMVFGFIYHLFYVIMQLRKFYVKPAKAANEYTHTGLLKYVYYSPLFPRYKDLVDIFDMFKYYTFLTNKPPKHERFYWREKLDYLAVFWGINMLGITGAILWRKDLVMSVFPSWSISVAAIAHSFEALLATADIVIWHMYNAHVNYDKMPASPMFLTGYLPEHIFQHEYVLEWKRVNELVKRDPSLVFDEDKWKEEERQRELDQYQETKYYLETMATAVKKGNENE